MEKLYLVVIREVVIIWYFIILVLVVKFLSLKGNLNNFWKIKKLDNCEFVYL